MTPQGVAILGSTGSIGTTALKVLSRQRERFEVTALTAHSNAKLLGEQVDAFSPQFVGLVNSGESGRAGWHKGPQCLIDASTLDGTDIVLNAVVGAAGLDATLAGLRAGKRVALANKESLVVAGAIVQAASREGGGEIVPVDSEHSAILQCISTRPHSDVRRIILTGSGGPFRGWSASQIERATIDEALRHPTWTMGRKITIDSATLANKALEVIEAHFLFGIPYDRIDVVIHPQSIVHSFVEFVDGSVVAQMSVPSMEIPVLYALTHPERAPDEGVSPFDPVSVSPFTFEPVDYARFPALRLGIEAGKRGGAAPAVFNAANEQGVALFLAGAVRFGDISKSIDSALGKLSELPGSTREELLAADAAARRHVMELF